MGLVGVRIPRGSSSPMLKGRASVPEEALHRSLSNKPLSQIFWLSSTDLQPSFPGYRRSRPWQTSTREARCSRVVALAWGRGKKKAAQQQQQQQQQQQVTPPGSKSIHARIAEQPLALKFGASLLLFFILLQAIRRLAGRGSMGSLESRGFITEGEQSTQSNDPFFTNMMRNVNTIQYEELSPEQIAAARQRRSQDRQSDEKVELDKIQLPANHPFAVSKQISDEEEQLQRARLNVRRGMPIRDLNELKAREDRAAQQSQSQQAEPSSRRESPLH